MQTYKILFKDATSKTIEKPISLMGVRVTLTIYDK